MEATCSGAEASKSRAFANLDSIVGWLGALNGIATTLVVVFNLRWGVDISYGGASIEISWLSFLWLVWIVALVASLQARAASSVVGLVAIATFCLAAIVAFNALFGSPLLMWQGTPN